jgi:hypothetical protein
LWQKLLFENSLQASSLFVAGGVSFVAAITMLVVEAAPGGLLRVEVKLGVALAPLHIAANEYDHEDRHDRKAEPGGHSRDGRDPRT